MANAIETAVVFPSGSSSGIGSTVTMTNLDVGVLLMDATLATGTNGFTSG